MHNTDNLTIPDPSSNTSLEGVVQTGGAKKLWKVLVKQIPPEIIIERLRVYSVSQQNLAKIDWWLKNLDSIIGNLSSETEERFQRWSNGR